MAASLLLFSSGIWRGGREALLFAMHFSIRQGGRIPTLEDGKVNKDFMAPFGFCSSVNRSFQGQWKEIFNCTIAMGLARS